MGVVTLPVLKQEAVRCTNEYFCYLYTDYFSSDFDGDFIGLQKNCGHTFVLCYGVVVVL